MAHENTVSFKVFLRKSETDEKDEVRRFGIDRDVVSNFSYLKEKLQAVFPALKSKTIIVSWKDGDGDEIVISSDEELMIALTEMQSDVYKLYVRMSDIPQQNSPFQCSSNDAARHIGVTCDGCNKEVEGFRYKCIQCHDFDLCACCEGKGMHSEHFMIRLPIPVSWRPQYGRRLAHHLSKSCRKSGRNSSGDSGNGGDCPWRDHRNVVGQPPFLDFIASYMNTFVNPSPTEGQNRGQEQNGAPSSQNTATGTNNAEHSYLMNVGKTIAQMLDPLGINVDISVSDNKKETTTKKEEKSPKTAEVPVVDLAKEEGSAKKEDNPVTTVKNDSRTEESKADSSAAFSSQPQSERESPMPDDWTVLNKEVQHSQNIETTQQSENDGTRVADTPVLPSPIGSASTAAASAAEAAMARARTANTGAVPRHNFPVFYPPPTVPFGVHQGPAWNPYPAIPTIPTTMYPHVIPTPLPPVTQRMPSAPATQRMPSPPTGPEQLLHGNPKVADAVQKMMAMGFSNEGGWLTQLLEIKDGDIEKALDVLQPVKK